MSMGAAVLGTLGPMSGALFMKALKRSSKDRGDKA
jgi:hypothetical protein